MKDHEEWLNEVLELIAPGTQFREGLENILRAKTGGLIILTENDEEIESLVDGGFKINAELTSTSLYELGKMDGAIVLDEDAENIIYANALLIPDPSISSSETGARHRTAERVAKQTSNLVIAISERRDIITLYKNDKKHVLEDIRVVLSKANQAVQTLEKYRKVFDQTLINLSALEFENLVTIADVVTVIKRAEMVLKIENEIEKFGAEVIITEESLHLKPGSGLNSEVKIETYQDHRMAMAFAPLAIKKDLEILNPEVVSKSFPDFWEKMKVIGLQ